MQRDAILNNANYSTLVGEYTYKLDGVTSEATEICHITGLPYVTQVPTNTGSNPWTQNQDSSLRCTFSWNDDGVKMEGISSNQVIISPSFMAPSDVDVKLTVPADLYSVCVVGIKAQSELKVRISGTEVYTQKGTVSSGLANENTDSCICDVTNTLTSSNPYIEIENAYAMKTAYVYVKSVTIMYN